jgi:hypothetical protein
MCVTAVILNLASTNHRTIVKKYHVPNVRLFEADATTFDVLAPLLADTTETVSTLNKMIVVQCMSSCSLTRVTRSLPRN